MKVSNITALVDFGRCIDFPAGTVYNPRRFPGGIYKMHGITYLIFKNGKVVIVGCKGFNVLEKALKYLEKHFGVTYQYDIKNIVGSHDYQKTLDLCDLYNRFRGTYRLIYEPELFCALRMYINNALATIFHNGKMYITGAKNKNHLDTTFALVSHELMSF